LLGPVREILAEFNIQSILIVPVVFQEQVLGSFSLDAIGRAGAFSAEEIELCQLFAAQVAVAIANAKLLTETKQRADQLETLRQTMLALASERDRDSLLHTIIQQAVLLLDAKSGGIDVYHPDAGYLEVVADYGRPESMRGYTLLVGQGMAGSLVQSKESYIVVDNYYEWPGRVEPFASKRTFGAVIAVALKWQEEIVGVLYVDDEVGRKFDEKDAGLLQLFADQAAIALINAELVARDIDKLRRLEKLSQASNEIMGSLGDVSLEERLHLIARHATEILEAEACGISLVKHTGLLHFVASHGYREGAIERGREFAILSGPKSGLTGHIAHEGKLFNAHGSQLTDHFAVKGETLSPTIAGQCHSLLAIPLKRWVGEEEELVGLLRVENKKDKEGKSGPQLGFTAEDESILKLFADAVVVAIESAELVENLNEQKEQRELLLAASNLLAQAENLAEGLQGLAQMMVTFWGVTFCRIFLLDSSEQSLSMQAVYPLPGMSDGLNWRPALGEATAVSEWPRLTELLYERDCSILKIGGRQSRPILQRWSSMLSLARDIQSLLVVPLRTRDKVVGLLDLGELRPWPQAPFSADKQKLAVAIAEQTAVLIERIRLHEMTERREQLLVTLDETLRYIRVERETSKLLQEVVRSAAKLTGCTIGGLFVNSPHLGKLALSAVHGLPANLVGSLLSHSEGLIGKIACSGETMFTNHYQEWPDRETLFAPFDFKMVVGVPLKQAGEVEAVLFVADTRSDHWAIETHLEILQRFAIQATIALQTSRLISGEQRMFAQFAILHRLSDYIQAADDLQKILHVVLTGVTASYGLGFNRAALILVDESQGKLIGRMGIGHFERSLASADWVKDRQVGLDDFGEYLKALEKDVFPLTPVGEHIQELQLPLQSAVSDAFSRAIQERHYIRVTPDEFDQLPRPFVASFEPALPLIIVPLTTRDDVIGLLVADNKFTQAPITDEDVELLLTFANTAAIAIDKTRLFNETKIAQERLHSFYEASNTLVSSQEPEKVLQDIVEQALVAANAAWVCLILIDEIAGQVQKEIVAVADKKFAPAYTIRSNGLSMEVMRTGKAVVIEDVKTEYDRINPSMFQNGVAAALCLPLSLRDRRIGVMWVHYNEPCHFFVSEIEALQLYVNQAAIAYDDARRMDELENMRRATEALAATTTLPGVLAQIAHSARQVLHADVAAVWSYDDERQKFILKDSVGDDVPDDLWQAFRRKEPQPGGTAYTVMERSWTGITDITAIEQYPFLADYTLDLLGQIGVKSFQGAALKVGDEKLGVLYANYRYLRRFSEEDEKMARTFANHAALALKNAKLLDRVNKARNTARVVAGVTTLENLEDTLRSVVEGTRDALNCDVITLYVYDKDRSNFIYPPKMVGVNYPDEAQRFSEEPKSSLIYEILGRDQMYIADNVATEPLFKGRRFVQDEDIASCVAIPLQMGIERVGVMFVNYRAAHRFTSDELDNIELFANQAAVAIHNAQLYERQQKQTIALHALYEAGRAVTGPLDLDEILKRIVEQAWYLVSYENRQILYASIALKDGEKAKIVAAYPPEELTQTYAILGDEIILDATQNGRIGIVGRAIKTGEPQLAGDVAQDPDYLQSHAETRSELAVPLKLGKTVIGAINVEHSRYNAFDSGHIHALESLAAQAAVAMQNAQAYQEGKILQKVAASLAGSLELSEVLNLVIVAAMDLTHTDSGSVLFWDAAAQCFSPTFTTDGPERKLVLYKTTARVKEGIAWNIVKHKKPIIIRDTHSQPGINPVALQKRRRSFIGVPLFREAAVMGVLFISSSEPRHFSDHQMALLETLASQVTVAIDKARQYEDLKHANKELERINQLVETTTAAAVFNMTGGIWRHDMVSDAQTIKGQSEFLRQDLNRLQLHKQHAEISRRLDIIERSVKRILDKPIMQPLSTKEGTEAVVVNELIRGRVHDLWRIEPYQIAELLTEWQLSEVATVQINPVWLLWTFDVLVKNAVNAVAKGELRQITVGTRTTDDGIEIFVADTGPGMSAEVWQKIGQKVIKKPEDEKGMGMGLLLAQIIASTYGGRVRPVYTGPQGTEMAIWLPFVQVDT
jgi:GAF domain-containing protein